MSNRRYNSTRFYFPTADFIFYAPFDRHIHDIGRSKLTGTIAAPVGNRIVISRPIAGGVGTPHKPVFGYQGSMVTDNYITYGANSINGPFDYTFGVWANLRAFWTSGYRYLICHDPTTNNALGHSMQLLCDTTGNVIRFRRNSTSDVTFPIVVNKWYFYTFVYTHANATSKYYVNGRNVGSYTGTHTYDTSAARNFFINCKTNNAPTQYEWDGQWSEIFCIKGALPSSKVLDFYNYMVKDDSNVPSILTSLNDPWAPIIANSPAYIDGLGIAVYSKAYLWQMEWAGISTPAYLKVDSGNYETIIDYESFEYRTRINTLQDVMYEPFEGISTVSVGIGAYVDVSAIIDSSTPAYVCGLETTAVSTPAFIECFRPDTNPVISSPAFIWAWDTKVYSEPAYLFGMIKPIISTPAFINGLEDITSEGLSGYVEGSQAIAGSTDAEIWGKDTIISSSNAFVNGLDYITTGIPAYNIGFITINADSIGGYVVGSDAPAISTKAYLLGYNTIQVGISGWVDTATAIGLTIPSWMDTAIQVTPVTIGAHLHIVDYSDVSSVAYTLGMQFISGGVNAHLHDYYDLSRSSPSYVRPYDRLTTGIFANMPAIVDYANSYSTAWVFGISGTLTPSITGYLEGYDSGVINSLAYVDTSLVVTSDRIDAYINPIKLDHRISILAYLSVSTHIGNGLTGFAHYDDVVITDLTYNKVSTLVCDYYSGSGDIVFNTFLVNGKRYNVYDIRMRTSAAWAGKIKILHGAVEPYLTDNWDTTYSIPGPINPDVAISTKITVINPGVTGMVIIPIEITHSNAI